MKMSAVVLLTVALASASDRAAAQTQPAAPQKYPLASYLLRGFDGIQRNLVEAAEKMPEEHYGFRATPETKPFGQIVAHIALSRFGACSAASGAENPQAGVKEDQSRTKAQAVTLLKDAGAFCSKVFSGLTDEALTQMVQVGVNKNEVAKGVFIAGENSHGNEVYGTMAVYLRLKGLVPPSTERAQQRKTQ